MGSTCCNARSSIRSASNSPSGIGSAGGGRQSGRHQPARGLQPSRPHQVSVVQLWLRRGDTSRRAGVQQPVTNASCCCGVRSLWSHLEAARRNDRPCSGDVAARFARALLPEGPVEPELGREHRVALGRDAALADQKLDRIARDQPDQRKERRSSPRERSDREPRAWRPRTRA
jgi:hypothetical protein